MREELERQAIIIDGAWPRSIPYIDLGNTRQMPSKCESALRPQYIKGTCPDANDDVRKIVDLQITDFERLCGSV